MDFRRVPGFRSPSFGFLVTLSLSARSHAPEKVPGLFSASENKPGTFSCENKPGTFSCFLVQMEILARRL